MNRIIEKTKVHCPVCNKKVDLIIKEIVGFPYESYDAFCEDCNYWIMESEIE